MYHLVQILLMMYGCMIKQKNSEIPLSKIIECVRYLRYKGDIYEN